MFCFSAQVLPIQKCDASEEEGIFLRHNSKGHYPKIDLRASSLLPFRLHLLPLTTSVQSHPAAQALSAQFQTQGPTSESSLRPQRHRPQKHRIQEVGICITIAPKSKYKDQKVKSGGKANITSKFWTSVV